MLNKQTIDGIEYLVAKIQIYYHLYKISSNEKDKKQNKEAWRTSKENLLKYLDKIIK